MPYKGRLPKSLEPFRDKIATFYDFGRGDKTRYHIDLIPGWHTTGDEHAVIELTVSQCVAELRKLERVTDCEECAEDMAGLPPRGSVQRSEGSQRIASSIESAEELPDDIPEDLL